ncbi:hypothetical protein Pelo_6852 [Pelomyxa schiedti]|nr:hypothetical protein Pelo_6852 [Pelomyxa schiedti]
MTTTSKRQTKHFFGVHYDEAPHRRTTPHTDGPSPGERLLPSPMHKVPAWDCQIVGRYYPLCGSILQCKMSPLYVVVASQPSRTISFSPLVTVKVAMCFAFPISMASAFAILGICVTCFSVEHESIMIVTGLSLTFPIKVDNQVPNLLPNVCVPALASELAAVCEGIAFPPRLCRLQVLAEPVPLPDSLPELAFTLSTISPLVTISSTVMTFDVTISRMRCI